MKTGSNFFRYKNFLDSAINLRFKGDVSMKNWFRFLSGLFFILSHMGTEFSSFACPSLPSQDSEKTHDSLYRQGLAYLQGQVPEFQAYPSLSLKAALLHFKPLAELGYPQAMNALGDAYRYLGKIEKALAWYQQASFLGCPLGALKEFYSQPS